ncbi:hypothetical protein TNCV_1775651 [Trichonephila clavipes]|nr:hypothetical protein TNCV_1775651 [Trichonephila clavipes]
MPSKLYGESTMQRSKVYEVHRHFKDSRGSIEYNERIGRTLTSWTAENVVLVSEYVRKDRYQALEKIAEAIHFSKMSFEGNHSS